MKKVILFFLFMVRVYAYDYEVSIAAMFRDEAPYFKEWIEYHKLIGVEHFYLYNDESKDNFMEVLEPYIQAGVVELFNCPKMEGRTREKFRCLQKKMLFDAAERAKGVSKWVAFTDIDEFIFPVEDKTLPKFLTRYEKYGAVKIKWQLFGTSNIQHLRKDQLMIEQLVFRAKKDYDVLAKSIVQVEFMDTRWDPDADCQCHFFKLLNGNLTVNSNEIPIKCSDKLPLDKIRIHHYHTRDEDFLHNVKLKRPNANSFKTDIILKNAHNSNKVEDRSILIYANELRNAVFCNKNGVSSKE